MMAAVNGAAPAVFFTELRPCTIFWKNFIFGTRKFVGGSELQSYKTENWRFPFLDKDRIIPLEVIWGCGD